MSNGDQNARVIRAFDLTKNPFFVLDLDLSASIERISELLNSTNSADEREWLIPLKAQLEQKRARRYWGWGIFATFVGLIVFANLSDKQKRSTPTYNSPAYTPPRTTPDYSPPPDYSSRSSDPTQVRPTQTPEPKIEIKPPVGVGITFTQANLRYCKYQEERLTRIQQAVLTNTEKRAFKELVDDYNSRCSNYKYRQADSDIVAAELATKSDMLASEANAILSGWRRPIAISPLTSVRTTGQEFGSKC